MRRFCRVVLRRVTVFLFRVVLRVSEGRFTGMCRTLGKDLTDTWYYHRQHIFMRSGALVERK